MCGSSKRDFETWDAGLTVSWQHPSRTSLTPRYTANALARKEKERMYRDDEEARSVAAPSQKENRPLDRAPTPGAVLAPLACHLIGRTAVCVEHIGKAIRNMAENNNVVSTSAIVSRYFVKIVISYISIFYYQIYICLKMCHFYDNL